MNYENLIYINSKDGVQIKGNNHPNRRVPGQSTSGVAISVCHPGGGQVGLKGNGEQAEVSKEGGRGDDWGWCGREAG